MSVSFSLLLCSAMVIAASFNCVAAENDLNDTNITSTSSTVINWNGQLPVSFPVQICIMVTTAVAIDIVATLAVWQILTDLDMWQSLSTNGKCKAILWPSVLSAFTCFYSLVLPLPEIVFFYLVTGYVSVMFMLKHSSAILSSDDGGIGLVILGIGIYLVGITNSNILDPTIYLIAVILLSSPLVIGRLTQRWRKLWISQLTNVSASSLMITVTLQLINLIFSTLAKRESIWQLRSSLVAGILLIFAIRQVITLMMFERPPLTDDYRLEPHMCQLELAMSLSLLLLIAYLVALSYVPFLQ